MGYGVPAFGGRLVAAPELGVGLSAGDRTYRLGWRLSPAATTPGSGVRPGSGSFDLSVEAARRERASGAPEHAVGVRLNARY